MSRQQDLVSVIIPYYNHGAYVLEAIDSILAQTYRNFEIVLVDDGSNDPRSLEVLAAIDIPEVTIYRKPNGHLSSARNHGIRNSRGEMILTLDADDRFDPSFLEKAVPILKGDDRLGVVTCHVRRFGSDRGLDGEIWRPKGGDVTNFLVENNCCGNSLFRYVCWTDAGGYDEKLRGFEDWDFWLSVTQKKWQVHTIPEVLFHYRDLPGSLYRITSHNRRQLMTTIVENHLESYRTHVVYVVSELLRMKEEEKQALHDKLRDIKRSKAYRISSRFLNSLSLLGIRIGPYR